MNILAIDPGNIVSGWCVVDSDSKKPIEFGVSENKWLLFFISFESMAVPDGIVIERVASYGMPVGKEVFETCEWIGRFAQHAEHYGIHVDYLYRREEKLHICHDSKAKDANIRRALIDRFATHDMTNGKGTKKDPDWFYGFRQDVWAAYAIAITYIETKLNTGSEDR